MFKRFGFIISIGLSASAIGQSLIFTPENEPVEVAASSFGNKAIRMVTQCRRCARFGFRVQRSFVCQCMGQCLRCFR